MTEPSNVTEGEFADADDEISVLDLLIVLAKHKWLILGLPFVVAVLAAVYSIFLPIGFTATTKILPPLQGQSSASAMLAQLGGLAGLAAGAAKNPSDVYVAMLKSRSVADNLIQRFGLAQVYGGKYPSQVREKLTRATNIGSNKDGIITIEVDDGDPKRAADMANAYVDELEKLTQVLAVTDASRRRLFFERQFAQAKDNLANAEAAAGKALERGGLVKVDDQGRAMIEDSVRLRAQITVKEVQLGAMRTFAADRNPDLQRAQQELESMKRELRKIEGAGGTRSGTNGPNGPNGQGTNSLRLLREVKYNEVIFDLLARQYEGAKIDEAKDSAVVQVMDKAIEPDFRSSPKRTLFVLLCTLAAGFVAVLWAFVLEAMAKSRGDPQQAHRLQDLRSYLLTWR